MTISDDGLLKVRVLIEYAIGEIGIFDAFIDPDARILEDGKFYYYKSDGSENIVTVKLKDVDGVYIDGIKVYTNHAKYAH